MTRPKLIKSGLVATLVPGAPDVVACDILIRDGKIADIAPHIECEEAEVIDASDMLVMPGFVDTHRHTWQTAFRGIASDWSLAQYGVALHGMFKPCFSPEDMYLANHLGRIEALNGGITTMLDWAHGILSPDLGDAAAQALIDAPGRSIFGYCGNIVAPSSDEDIEPELRRIRRDFFPGDDGLVTMALALRGPQYSSIHTTIKDVCAGRDLGLRVTVHGGSASWGKNRPVGQMCEHGLLDEKTTVVHCNSLANDELRMMADCGCTASLSPDAEIQMGFGWPATGRLLDVGIRPSLSIDDCAAVCGDMFRTMHSLLLVQRGLDNLTMEEPTDQRGLRLSARDAVEFATIEGARACGIDHRIGTIETGKQADLIMLRTDDLSLFPLNHPLGQIVSSGHPGLVDTVLVSGRIVKRLGRLIGVDLDRLRKETLRSRERILAQAISKSGGRSGPLRLDGSWHPETQGYSSSDMRPEG